MISLKCFDCGFFFSIDFPDDISEEERKEICTCPCGSMMEEVPFSMDYIPTIEGRDARQPQPPENEAVRGMGQ